MVKPSIISPEALKKEAGKEEKLKEVSLPAFAVIPLGGDLPLKEEEPEEAVPVAAVNRPSKLGLCMCFVMLLTVLLIVGLATAMFLGRASGKKYKFFCAVDYDQDVDYLLGDPDMMQGKPSGNLDEDVEIRPFEGYEQMEIPAQDYCERLTIIHDFTMNLTAYKLYSSAVCYIGKLDEQTVMAPSEFIEKAEENPAFLSDHYDTVTATYRAVLPELTYVGLEYGLFIPMLCSDVATYRIERIPADQLAEWEEYWDEEDEEDESDEIEFPMDDFRPRAPPHDRRRREADKKPALDKVIEFTGKVITKLRILKPEAVEAKETAKK